MNDGDVIHETNEKIGRTNKCLSEYVTHESFNQNVFVNKVGIKIGLLNSKKTLNYYIKRFGFFFEVVKLKQELYYLCTYLLWKWAATFAVCTLVSFQLQPIKGMWPFKVLISLCVYTVDVIIKLMRMGTAVCVEDQMV